MIMRWGQYEKRCEMELIYNVCKVEQIIDYSFIDKIQIKLQWLAWMNVDWLISNAYVCNIRL